MHKADSRADLWAGRISAKKARMTESKRDENVQIINAVEPNFPIGRMYCSAVPTSAKQVELRARHEAAQSLPD